MSWSFEALHLREIRLPLVEPFVTAHGRVEERRILLLEARDGDGHQVWSECVAGEAPTYTAESVETAWLVLERWLLPAVLGRRFEEPPQVAAVLEDTLRGHPMAKAAVEMAAWALVAELQGVPLARLLAGEGETPRPSVEAGLALGFADDPDQLAARAVREAERGYRRLKLKIEPGRDLQPVAAVARVLGDSVPLAVGIASASKSSTTSAW